MRHFSTQSSCRAGNFLTKARETILGIERANWPFQCAESRGNIVTQLCPSADSTQMSTIQGLVLRIESNTRTQLDCYPETFPNQAVPGQFGLTLPKLGQLEDKGQEAFKNFYCSPPAHISVQAVSIAPQRKRILHPPNT